jgi:hypothetical protein
VKLKELLWVSRGAEINTSLNGGQHFPSPEKDTDYKQQLTSFHLKEKLTLYGKLKSSE